MNGIRRIFYDKVTGDKIHEIGRNGSFTLPTIEQDIATFTALSERNRDTFDVLELPFGAYAQDFAESAGYRVNPETKQLEFMEKPTEEGQEPVYIAPLSEQLNEANAKINRLESQNDLINSDLMGLMDALTETGVL